MEDVCHHPNREVRRRKDSLGRDTFVEQCLDCGAVCSANLSKSKVAKLGLLADFDEELQKAGWERERARWEELRAEADRQGRERDAEWWGKYNAYLQTPEWKAKRLAVLRRCGGLCEGCGQELATTVHHRTYAHVGAEFLFELVGLCENCHTRFHPHMQKEAERAAYTDSWSTTDTVGFRRII